MVLPISCWQHSRDAAAGKGVGGARKKEHTSIVPLLERLTGDEETRALFCSSPRDRQLKRSGGLADSGGKLGGHRISISRVVVPFLPSDPEEMSGYVCARERVHPSCPNKPMDLSHLQPAASSFTAAGLSHEGKGGWLSCAGIQEHGRFARRIDSVLFIFHRRGMERVPRAPLSVTSAGGASIRSCMSGTAEQSGRSIPEQHVSLFKKK